MEKQRGSGILLPVFSLPGKYGIGCFSSEAEQFIDFLKKAGQKYWQILPLGPTGYGDSPYQSFSTFAINPYFIDPEYLYSEGLVSAKDLKSVIYPKEKGNYIDYEWLYNTRFNFLRKAFDIFCTKPLRGFKPFCRKNADWLNDYALFMAVKDSLGGVSFDNWPQDIRFREKEAVNRYTKDLKKDIEFYRFLQFMAYKCWLKLKKYANSKGIDIIGDIPIYVAADSSDTWTGKELFQMDENVLPKAVAGCPPDGFSADGQLWGNPLYDWEYHAKTGYEWWCRRIEKCLELYDVIRIDHFRGFDEYYSIPYGDKTARNGHWCKGPGIELFKAIENKLGNPDIIAEDLGFMTDSVRKLVKDTCFPNMKVLEFAFDARDDAGPSEYLPHTYGTNCVVYTGTHDNETLYGWLSSIQPAELENVRKYVKNKKGSFKSLVKNLIVLAEKSNADRCIIPLQDYLCLGNEARINHPSTLGGNWVWRMKGKELTDELAARICEITKDSNRKKR